MEKSTLKKPYQKKDNNPYYLQSPITLEQTEVVEQIANLTGSRPEFVEDVFEAFAKLLVNNHLQGVNVALPKIGIFKIRKSHFPVNAFVQKLADKYGTVKSHLNGKDYVVLFVPRLVMSPLYRLQIVDSLPKNEVALRTNRMPFADGFPRYNYDLNKKPSDKEIDDEDPLDTEF